MKTPMGFQVQERLIRGLQRLDIKITHITIAFVLIVFVLTIGWINVSNMAGVSRSESEVPLSKLDFPKPQKFCSVGCPGPVPTRHVPQDPSSEACPGYFRWIHEDLRPWKRDGITRETIEKAKKVAHMRLIIINGKAYVQKFKKVYQTRDVITVWGILQLLTLYPGKLPDLDLMFECNDYPVILKEDYGKGKSGSSIPPPIFHYCGDDSSFDIVFPDWSFWGWPELNIMPWEFLKGDLEEGNHVTKWMDRKPYAFWKGNTKLGKAREGLMRCNVSQKQDFGFHLFDMKWHTEKKSGFRTSNLATQCDYRYKIYVEGKSWSVSEKYILSCDSMTLILDPQFYDFFTRSLVPTVHYWPIDDKDKCNAIKFAVEWGNQNTEKAQNIGKAASKFIQEELKMKFIYDYMFHLLNEYGKLLKYQPTIPDDAVEVCSDNMLCGARGVRRSFRTQTRVNESSHESPCLLPSPFNPRTRRATILRNEKLRKAVEMMRQAT